MSLAPARFMDAIQPQYSPLALEPVAASTPDAVAARPTGDGTSAQTEGQHELRITIADEFLAAATREYQDGHIDAALWARAAAQSGADKSMVVAAYLRARATALRLQKRDKRLERRASRASPRLHANARKAQPEPHSEALPAEAIGVRLRGVQLKPGYVAAAAAALASVAVFAWLMVAPQDREPVGQPSASAAVPSAKRSASASRVDGAKGGPGRADSAPALEAVVQQHKDAGNWNVLVLYASKWTRDEPNNAVAWNELSIGYANLRQYNDALSAAEKAVAISPQDAWLWRNLGHLNLNLERLPEAGSAFDRVLALSADDADALCGAALVAQRLGRTNDAEAIARRAKAAAGGCPGLSDGESVAVVVRQSAARKPASPVGR